MNARTVGLLVISLLVLGGCASVPKQVKSDAEVVKERSQARWDAMVKGDFKTGYLYLSPAGKTVFTEAAYDANYRRGFWTGANVEKVQCPTVEVCEADVMVSYAVNGVPSRSPLREKWVRQESDWWFVLEK